MILVFTKQTKTSHLIRSEENDFRSGSENKVSNMKVDSNATISGTVRILEIKASKYLKLIPR